MVCVFIAGEDSSASSFLKLYVSCILIASYHAFGVIFHSFWESTDAQSSSKTRLILAEMIK